MAKSCAIVPKVVNKNNVKVDSRLFKDLLSFNLNNRQETVRQYLITKSDNFINNWLPKLKLDENGEPLISSLLKSTNIKEVINQDKILKTLNRRIGFYKDSTFTPRYIQDTSQNREDLIQKATQFNNTSEFKDDYVANIVKSQDPKTLDQVIGVKISPRNRELTEDADKMEYNSNLNMKLREILNKAGISVGVLSKLEERLGISGVTDFDVARTSAEGLIELIRLAKGEKGELALPEEFSHCVFEMIDEKMADRLINLLVEKNLIPEILGDTYEGYVERYNNDPIKLAKEAAGKLLAKHLIQHETIPQKPYRNLLQRIIDSIKNILRSLDSSDISRAMREADKQYGDLAKQILEGSISNTFDVRNIKASGSLFSTTKERVERDKALLQRMIETELKRLKIYENRHKESFNTKQTSLIQKLEEALRSNQELEGIYTYLEHALSELTKVANRIADLNNPDTSINSKAFILRNIRDYIYSYKRMTKEVRKILLEERNYADNRYEERAKIAIDRLTNLIEDLESEYTSSGIPLFIEFLKPFFGNSLTIPFGRFKGRTMTIEKLIKKAENDISIFDRWLDSMADSSDYILKIMDQAVKRSKNTARLRTVDIMKKLQEAHMKLEEAGVKSTEWMFERTEDGKKTGRYITEVDHAKFTKDRKAFEKHLLEKYKDPFSPLFAHHYNEWWEKHTIKTTDSKGNIVRTPNPTIYQNKQFAALNAAQKEYYNTVISIKAQLDSYLPNGYTSLYNTIKIRKDLLERVKNSDSVKSGAKQIWENIKDQFIRRTDDTDIGTKATLKDFEDHEVQLLPIYYTKKREGESEDDMSSDVTATLTAYAAMANEFKEMNKIIELLELGRDILRDRDVAETRAEKPLNEEFSILGRKVSTKLFKPKEKSYFMDRLNSFFEMQVYGRYMKDEGTFGKSNIDKAKTANFVNRMTSLNSLALNLLQSISNVATGKVMMRIESFAKEFFTERDTIIADRNYAAALPSYLAEIGNRVKTSKLALFDELFNILQEYEVEIKETNFDRKTWFSRMFGTKTLFMLNNAGEHWIQNRTALALANAYKMKGPNGESSNLWEALEVVYINPNNHKYGAKLKIKEGYTKEDGTKFTEKDIFEFSRKAAGINQRMHGIYNKEDRSAIQSLAIGRMAILFRKWIKPSFNRRFGYSGYNYDIQAWTEGYYRTLGRFLLNVTKELKEGQLSLATMKDRLTPTERANITRAATEVGHLLAVAIVIALIESGDDDEDKPWFQSMVEYQLRRLYTEIGSMSLTLDMPNEALKILRSPAAGITTIEHTLDLVGVFNPFNYEELLGGEDAVIQSGRYKGHNKGTKLFFESPLIPMNKTIYKGLHPEEGIPFYKQ